MHSLDRFNDFLEKDRMFVSSKKVCFWAPMFPIISEGHCQTSILTSLTVCVFTELTVLVVAGCGGWSSVGCQMIAC